MRFSHKLNKKIVYFVLTPILILFLSSPIYAQGTAEKLLNGAMDGMYNTFFGLVEMAIETSEQIMEQIIDGVLGFGILNNKVVTAAYQGCMSIMLVVLPFTLIWQLFRGSVAQDEEIDVGKKILQTILAIVFAFAIPTLLTVGVSMQRGAIMILSGDGDAQKIIQSYMDPKTGILDLSDIKFDKEAKKFVKNNKNYSKEMVISVLNSIGGMNNDDKYHSASAMYYRIVDEIRAYDEIDAEGKTHKTPLPESMLIDPELISQITVDGQLYFEEKGDFYAYRRYSDKSDQSGNGTSEAALKAIEESDAWGSGNHADKVTIESSDGKFSIKQGVPHIWVFNFWGSLIGCIALVIFLVVLMFQIAGRTMFLAFLKAIGPLCCISLTSNDRQAYTVWSQTIRANLLTTVAQIFTLLLFNYMGKDILTMGEKFPLASLAMFFSGLMLTISLPPFVHALVGGYKAGIMEGLQQASGLGHMAMNAVSGAIGGMIGAKTALMGKTNTQSFGNGGSSDIGNAGGSAGGSGGPGGSGSSVGSSKNKQPHSIMTKSGGLRGMLGGQKRVAYDENGKVLWKEKSNRHIQKLSQSAGRMQQGYKSTKANLSQLRNQGLRNTLRNAPTGAYSVNRSRGYKKKTY